MVSERTARLRKIAESFFSRYESTHCIVPFGSVFRGSRYYGLESLKDAPATTKEGSDIDVILVNFESNIKPRVIMEEISGTKILGFELPFEIFRKWFDPSARKAEYVRMIPLTTDLSHIRGKNAKLIKDVFLRANIQSTKLVLERWLYEHPNERITTPVELAKILMKQLVPLRIMFFEPQYYLRKGFLRQITSNIEDALEAAKFAKRLEPKGMLRKASARFKITANLKPKRHAFKPLRADFEFLKVIPKKKAELYLGITEKTPRVEKAVKWVTFPFRITQGGIAGIFRAKRHRL